LLIGAARIAGMSFLRFYLLVFGEAFRHSLDIAQAIIFVLLMLTGFIVARNPSTRPIVDALDLSGWKVAAIVSAGIVAIRLVMAPYWLWRSLKDRIVTAPKEAIDYRLRVQGISNVNDKKAKAIQIGFNLHNSSLIPIQYEVEDVNVTVEDKQNDDPKFHNMGGVVAGLSNTLFSYDWIQLQTKTWIKPGTKGTAGITYKYGIAGQPCVRRARQVCNFIIEKASIRVFWIEDSEESI
jgi:hypothetical protein